MSLPDFSGQRAIFDVENLMGQQFPVDDPYRLFSEIIYPPLAKIRAQIAAAYCPDNGRPGIEPVLLMGVCILQYMDSCPDREAVQRLRYHLGWKLALHLELGLQRFDPSTLCHFRQRLLDNQQAKLAFDAVLQGLMEAGLIDQRSARRLDSTHVLGKVARMSVLEMLRETMRLALKELAQLPESARPGFWAELCERYVDNKLDYRLADATLRQKQLQVGQDMTVLLAWVKGQDEAVRSGAQVQLLERVLGENFQHVEGQLENKDQAAGVVKNPHDPEVQWGKKGPDKSQQWNGYKAQICETVADESKLSSAADASAEAQGHMPQDGPTVSFITAIVTQPATGSDDAGLDLVAAEEQASGLEPAPRLYVDAGYTSGGRLREAETQGRELIGPVKNPPQQKVFRTDRFDVDVAHRTAVCPAGKPSSTCTVFDDSRSGKTEYRFGWGPACADCPLRQQCVGKKQEERTLNVNEDHPWLQARRRAQEKDAFKQRMHHRNAVEGTVSELVRGHGLRQAKYRGLEKARLQNYFIGAACNAKRWIRLAALRIRQGAQEMLTWVESALSEPATAG